jgi:hypothetical protein
MIMMPYGWPWPSPQVTGHADFWHPTGQVDGRPADLRDCIIQQRQQIPRRGVQRSPPPGINQLRTDPRGF